MTASAWILTLIAVVLYAVMIRDIARELRRMMTDLGRVPPYRRVRVWFGEHLIADFIGAPEDAARYEADMRQRSMSLRIITQPAIAMVSPDAADS